MPYRLSLKILPMESAALHKASMAKLHQYTVFWYDGDNPDLYALSLRYMSKYF
jgi:hypothetical protein